MNPRPLPVYRRIADVLRREILDGRRRAGSLLPSERELCQHFSVARATVRHSLQLLVHENLAVPVQGVGYVIATAHAPLHPAPDPPSVRVPVALLNTAVEMLETCDTGAASAAASRVATLLRAAVRAR
ncbi:winged helix-turn-helix domain-containing protein [Streptomyces sp. NPDC050392]|uniref:winged helix-turn-helix domain-containing protein n=1 Tax=Streptomyces sp. NPDC050392 TaxID=3155782 RepID=UPI0034144453